MTALAGHVHTTNLPADLTSFVGRRRELGEVKRLLSGARLVTLTGVGGVGKTRLALRAAIELRRAFPDGVWLVELADLRDPELLAQTVATALGLRNRSARRPLAVLGEFLAARQVLLVLDNCEQLLDACAVLAESLLRRCPGLRIMATSRQPLGISGETTLLVSSLSVPDPDRPPPLQGLARYEAVTLFTDRAAAALPEFGLTEDNHAAVAGICQRLDGLPLAIELAAVRLRALSPNQILERLTSRHSLLTGGSRAAPDRQHTLRDCIDWSFQLCSPEEQTLWTRLAVFSGGFELDAVEGICAGDGLELGALLDLVVALVDKSILLREEHGTVVRYRLLETIRDYARDKLQASGAEPALRRRHRDWYQQLVLRAHRDRMSPRQADWFGRLDREDPNLQAALDFCLTEPGEAEVAVKMLVALRPIYWWARGLLGEGRHWLDLALAQATEPNVPRARALLLNSLLAIGQGDFENGRPLLEEGRVLARQLGHATTLAFADYVAGHAAMYNNELSRAIEFFEHALTILTAVPGVNRRVETLVALVVAAGLAGDRTRATACHEEVLILTEPRGECFNRSNSLWAFGLAVWRQGDAGRAAELQHQSLRLKRGLDDRFGTALCVEALAWIAAADHRGSRAATLLGVAEALWQAMGTSPAAFQHLVGYHDECDRQTRSAIGGNVFDEAFRRGTELSPMDALGFALEEQSQAPPPRADGPALLTRREQQIAELVANGLSNKQIAQRLVIAQRTAEGHVEHILTKLGFTARTQIAAWIAEHR